MKPIDDTLLSAYVDGELADDERARVESHLRDDAEAAARVRLWLADREALRMTLDAQLQEPVPERLTAIVRDGQPAAAPRPWQPWLKAAMAAGLLAAGGLVGALVTRNALQAAEQAQVAQRWTQRAITAHAVYVPEVRHPVEVSVREGSVEQQRAQEEHLVKWLTKRLGMPVIAFDLSAHGFALVGGRLLPDAGQPGAQLMYQNDAGQRVTVYMRKPEAGNTDVAFRYEQQGEFGMYYWVDGDYGCAITGRLPRERLLALAEAVYKQHEDAQATTTR